MPCSAFRGLMWAALLAVHAGVSADPLAVDLFFKRSQFGQVQLSPGGRYLAMVAPIGSERQNVMVIDLEKRTAMPVSGFEEGDALRVLWQNEDRMIVFVGDLQRGSGEPPREGGVIAIDRDGSNPRFLSRRFGGMSIVRVIPGTNEILIATHRRSRRSLDLLRVDTKTGSEALITFESPGDVIRWVVDSAGVPRAVLSADPEYDKSAWYVRQSANAAWQKVEEAAWGRLQTFPMAFSADDKILYVESRRESDRAAIYEFEVATGKWSAPIVKHPERDIDAGFVVGWRDRRLLGLRFTDDKPAVVWFDAQWATMQKSVDAVLPDTVNALQRAGERWIVVAYSDRNPGDVYLLEGGTLKMEKLFSYRPWVKPGEMAATRWVRYRSRDGLTIPALLTVPKGSEGKRVPLVVEIHGGPNVAATRWGYNALVQFLASRGYAVLQPQFRGTNGFGANFLAAGFRKWGDEMQDDIEDGVKWAIAQGIADPDRVCFYGASYGGYAAMWGAIKNARIIKCAVALFGVSSIEYLFDRGEMSSGFPLAGVASRMKEGIGDPNTERQRFKRVSPLDNADKVGVPILLAYGEEDRLVPLVHGTAFRRALDRHRKTYEWVAYPGEAHGLGRDKNMFDLYGRVERFLAKYLAADPQMEAK